jgi:thiamine-phosphate pyrophosphorylase
MRQKFDLSVYFVVDPSLCGGRDMLAVVDAALKGGVTLLQYRDKTRPRDLLLNTARDLKALAVTYNVPLLINDHVDIAFESGADGVHLGQGDGAPGQARARLGENAIIGLTAFTPEHFAALDPALVDYAGTGPFYPTQTDKGKPVLGAEEFKKLCALSPVPVVGIGGITPQNAAEVVAAGAEGVAMMRALSMAPDPEAVARDFQKIVIANRRKERGNLNKIASLRSQ